MSNDNDNKSLMNSFSNDDSRQVNIGGVNAAGNVNIFGSLEETEPKSKEVLRQKQLDHGDILPNVNHWQGRSKELELLKSALKEGKKNLVGIQGLGGYGKSTLAVKLYEDEDINKTFTHKFWADMGLNSSNFIDFAHRLIKQIDRKSLEEKCLEADLPAKLVKCLQQNSCLVVIDNLETLFTENWKWQSPLWNNFFQLWEVGFGHGQTSKILVTSRENPKDIGKLHSFWLSIEGLDAASGESLLRSLEINGKSLDLREAVELVKGHPLSLMMIAGLLKGENPSDPQINDIRKYSDLFTIKGKHRYDTQISTEDVFNQSFKRLEHKLQRILISLCVYRKEYFSASAAFSSNKKPNDKDLSFLDKDLKELVARSFLKEFWKEGKHQFQLEPYVFELLKRKARNLTKAHYMAISYYSTDTILYKLKNTPTSITDKEANACLEIFHHYCELKEYEKALSIIQNIDEFLTTQGHYALQVELYKRLIKIWQRPAEQTKKHRSILLVFMVIFGVFGIWFSWQSYFQSTSELLSQQGFMTLLDNKDNKLISKAQ